MHDQYPQNYDSTYDDFIHLPRFNEGFNLILAGKQVDGRVIAGLGHASTYIYEATGIESFIGESGFTSATDFYLWVQQVTKLSLDEWESIEITLYWSKYQVESGAKEYWAWRYAPDPEALETNVKQVFAIRHKCFKEGAEEFAPLKVARMISYAKDVWMSNNPGKPFDLDSMEGYLDFGYYLTGVKPDEHEERTITWPSVDLVSVLGEIDNFKALGYSKIHLWEGDIGYSGDAMSKLDIKNLVRAFKMYGPDCPLMDLGMAANSFAKNANYNNNL